MVQPVQHGYADYGRYRAIADVLQINDNNVPVVAQKIYPAKFVGNTNSLFVHAFNAGTLMRVAIEFFADQALTVPLDTYIMDCDAASIIRQPIRVLGPYMQAIVLIGGGGNVGVTLHVWNTDGLGFAHAVGRDPTLINLTNQVVAAGATVQFKSVDVRAGKLSWSGHTTATAWSARIQLVDFNGTVSNLDQIDNSIGSVWSSRITNAPAGNIQIEVHNGDAAGKNFDLWLSRELLLD